MLKKENIYINLQGKSKEELTELYELVKDNLYTDFRFNSNNEVLDFEEGVWIGSSLECVKTKQEVTIQQLKEILQPMGTFKKGDTIIITDFGTAIPDGVFSLNRPYKLRKDITEGLKVEKDNDGFENGYSVETTLTMKIELYSETLQQQLEKAKAEVKRLKKEINKINIGDWCLRTDDCIFKVSGNDLNWARNHSEKITDQELINKLNKLIK